ncbi:peptidase G2, partial [Klebsiella pneumoniae]|uniref:hypothetical protein n=1 Tax=Klebsiella pneumoniae TaxID=573 RepID=UPI000DA09BA2
VVVLSHLDIRSIRSYNIRHIGHHKEADVKSKTAYGVILNNIFSVYPQYNGAYEVVTPRAMVISAYRNVLVNGFTAIGDGILMSCVTAIAIQYRDENVALHNIKIKGLTNS